MLKVKVWFQKRCKYTLCEFQFKAHARSLGQSCCAKKWWVHVSRLSRPKSLVQNEKKRVMTTCTQKIRETNGQTHVLVCSFTRNELTKLQDRTPLASACILWLQLLDGFIMPAASQFLHPSHGQPSILFRNIQGISCRLPPRSQLVYSNAQKPRQQRMRALKLQGKCIHGTERLAFQHSAREVFWFKFRTCRTRRFNVKFFKFFHSSTCSKHVRSQDKWTKKIVLWTQLAKTPVHSGVLNNWRSCNTLHFHSLFVHLIHTQTHACAHVNGPRSGSASFGPPPPRVNYASFGCVPLCVYCAFSQCDSSHAETRLHHLSSPFGLWADPDQRLLPLATLAYCFESRNETFMSIKYKTVHASTDYGCASECPYVTSWPVSNAERDQSRATFQGNCWGPLSSC